jgi:sugar phosphate isomerase/epimerase
MFGQRYIFCEHARVPALLPQIAETGLGIEVLFETTEDFYPQVRWEELLDLADAISDSGIPASVHAPFHNISLGSRDGHIQTYTLDVLTSAMEMARTLHSPHIVFHTGYLPQYPPKSRAKWLDAFSLGIEQLIIRASDLDIQLAMENTYEQDTSLFEEIFERFPQPILGMCLDTAHATCYGKVEPLMWPMRFADRICHIHCSDNDGREDLHMQLGTGRVNYRALLEPLARIGNPASITLEVAVEDAAASRDYLESLLNTMSGSEKP